MQSQNTVIKWILIILLVAICVTCFVLCMTLNKTSSGTNGTAATANAPKQVQEEKPTANTQSDEPTVEPIYSTLPRNATEYENYLVGHIGGTGSDVLENAFCFGKSYFAVIKTESNDYDFFIIHDDSWIILEPDGKVRVWNKDCLRMGETFFGDPDKDSIVYEKIGENIYNKVDV